MNEMNSTSQRTHILRWSSIAVTLAVTLAGALAAGACGSSTAKPERASAGTPPDLKESLGAAGYDVRDGAFSWFSVQDCIDLSMKSCYGNNPSSPYGLVRLPPLPDQPAGVGPPNWYPDGDPPMWRLRPDEAIILVGKTPPEADYYGFTPYLYDRVFEGARHDRFASLSDTANLLTFGAGGVSAFDRDVAIVFSSSLATETKVRDIVASAFPGRLVVPVRFAGSILNMGSSADADTMIMLMRVALFASEEAGKAYLASTPFQVLRATPRAEENVERFGKPDLVARTPPTDEQSLAATRDALVAAVKSRLGATATLATHAGATLLPDDGFACIEQNRNCLGDNRDTPYLSVPTKAPYQRFPATGTSLFIVGVNHRATGQATYANVAIYNFADLRGVASVVDDELEGSATEYLPNDPNAKLMYVYEFARDCGTRTHCKVVDLEAYGIADNAEVALSERAYLHPELGVGATGPALLSPTLIAATAKTRAKSK